MHKLGAPEGISLIYRASLVNAFNEMATLVDQRVLPVVELIIQPPPLRPQLIQHRQLTSDIYTQSVLYLISSVGAPTWEKYLQVTKPHKSCARWSISSEGHHGCSGATQFLGEPEPDARIGSLSTSILGHMCPWVSWGWTHCSWSYVLVGLPQVLSSMENSWPASMYVCIYVHACMHACIHIYPSIICNPYSCS